MVSLLPRRREPGGGATAVQDALEIGKDFGVIENEGGQGFHRIEGDLRGVVPGAELFGIQGFGDKHGGDGMLAGIAVGCGIHAEQPGQPHTQIGLLKGFADGGLLGTCRVRMGSGDTEYYERSEWLLISWFYVTVLPDLERP